MPPGGRQAGLNDGRPYAPKRTTDRQAQMTREIGGLVETAGAPPGRMQRHRHDRRRAGQHIASAVAHECRERGRQRTPSVVLQRVDDRSQRSLVGADRTGAVDARRRTAASGATRQGKADHAPGRQRIAATVAQRGRQRMDGPPAGVADWSVRRAFERRVARRARRREDHREKGVKNSRQSPVAGRQSPVINPQSCA